MRNRIRQGEGVVLVREDILDDAIAQGDEIEQVSAGTEVDRVT